MLNIYFDIYFNKDKSIKYNINYITIKMSNLYFFYIKIH